MRYLLFAGECPIPWRAPLTRFAKTRGLDLAFSAPRLTVFVGHHCTCVRVGASNCIIGTLFQRHGRARQLRSISKADVAAIERNGFKSLLHSFWGGYVAALDGGASIELLRDPSGALSCYFAAISRGTLVASDAELLFDTGLVDAAINHEELGRQLFRAGVPVAATALDPIRELLPGFALDVSNARAKPACCWSPWAHVEPTGDDPDQTAEQLRRVVQHSVAAWASTQERVLLSVSGGLDSSIVAAALASAGADAVCLTMFTNEPGGDERTYARALCRSLRLPLRERPYNLADIDIRSALCAHLPRPQDRAQAISYERGHIEVANEVGATAFMTGNGGDSVFGYSQSAAAVADRLMREGLSRGALATLIDVCRQTGCSIFEAGKSAWQLAHRIPTYDVRPNPLFLHEDLIATINPRELEHPWLDAPSGALPGKAAHIGWILRILRCLEASRGRDRPVLNPLMAQPIVEACLAIPSWQWRVGGRDRALARLAFARDLPRIITERRVKGSPSYFAAQLLEAFRAPIRERLLAGRLAASRIVDREGLERALAPDRPVSDLERVRILELVNVEAWLDSWERRREPRELPIPPITEALRPTPGRSSGPTR